MQIDQPDDAILLLSAMHLLRAIGPYMLTPYQETKVYRCIPDETHQQIDEIVCRLAPELQRIAERKYPQGKVGAKDNAPFLLLNTMIVAGGEEMSSLLRMLATATVVNMSQVDKPEPPPTGAYL